MPTPTRILVLAVFASLFATPVVATEGGIESWEWLGPGNIGGRVRAILTHPSDPSTLWVGAAAGGIWKTTDAGASWQPIAESMTSLAVTSLVMHPGNKNIMYAGTGEGFLAQNNRLDGTPGSGVFESLDGGQTWTQMPSTAAWATHPDDRFVNRLAIRNVGANYTLLAATNGGIYRSVNGGAFTKVYDGWVTDLKFTTAGTAVAGMMTYCYNVTCPPFDPSEEIINALYSSDDGVKWKKAGFSPGSTGLLSSAYSAGQSTLNLLSAQPFQRFDIVRVGGSAGELVQVGSRSGFTLPLMNPSSLSQSYPVGTPVELIASQRTELAVHAGNPSIVYASVGAGGGSIWKSTDGGQNFDFVSNPPENYLYNGNGNFAARAHYDTAIWVSPDDPDLLVVAGVEVFRSTNGGASLTKITNGRYVLPAFGERAPHVDHHVIVESIGYGTSNNIVYFGNDGGVHAAADILGVGAEAPFNAMWVNLNSGLGVTQFYAGAATKSGGVEWFMGGGQDNGRPHLKVSNGASPDPEAWILPFDNDTTDGSGGKGDDKYVVAIDDTDPQNPVFYALGTNLRVTRSTDGGNVWLDRYPDTGSTGRKLAPFVLDPTNKSIIVTGSDRVFRSNDRADNWTEIRGKVGSANCSAIDIAPSDPDTYWVAYDTGLVSVTENGHSGSPSWTDVGAGQLPSRLITDIAVSPTEPMTAFITLDAPSAGQPVDTVWFTCDGGNCWEPRTGSPSASLPPIRALTVRMHPTDPDRVYVGTDRGVYASDDRGLTWTKANGTQGIAPANVEVWELLWQGNEQLVAATNGRGMFRTEPVVRPDLFVNVASGTGTADSGNSEGAAWGDYDDDGDLDLYVGNHSNQPNRLYRNNGNGSFSNVATSSGTAGNGSTSAAVWADYDNDGNLDLYVTNSGSANALYRNDGDGTFTDVGSSAGVADTGLGRGAAWADYDADGLLDLYLVNNGANKLYRNLGNGSFADVTSGPLGDSGAGQGVSWTDYDDDGDLDIYLANWSGQSNRLLRNDGGSVFTDVTAATGTGGSETSNGVAWGDFDGDGDLDLYVNNSGPNRLYRNEGGVFTDVTDDSGTQDTGNGRGVSWQDYDNDGDLDLYVANFSGGANRLFRNECCGRFVDITNISGTGDTSATREGTWGDFDADGRLDLYVTNSGSNRLYSNAGGAPSANQWLHLDLVGTESNRSAIGARVYVTSGGESQMREVSGGSGLYSQNSLTLEFGFGRGVDVVETVDVRWPSGKQTILQDVPVNQRIALVEVCSTCPTAIEDGAGNLPSRVFLHAPVPNPFNPSTSIGFALPRQAGVHLRIYDVSGRHVRTLIAGETRTAGYHSTVWRGRDDDGHEVASGMYFCELRAAGQVTVRKMSLLR